MPFSGVGAAGALLISISALTNSGRAEDPFRQLDRWRPPHTAIAPVGVPCALVSKGDVDSAFAPIRFADASSAPTFCYFDDEDERIVSVSVYTLPAFISAIAPDSMKVLATKQSGRGTPTADVPDLGSAAFWYDETKGDQHALGLCVTKAGGPWMQLKARGINRRETALAGLVGLARIALARI